MNRFKYEDKTYSFDANACYDANSIIRLPDGRLLQVNCWLESLPPIPDDLQEIGVNDKLNATPATLVS